MNANKKQIDVGEEEEEGVPNKHASDFTKGFDDLTRKTNQVADRLFFWFVITCAIVLLIAWMTTDS